MGLNYIKQSISCEDMTSQTDNHLGYVCCESHCSIVLHTFSKIHNFLISYPILLKLFLIGLSDFSAFIESNLFFKWTCPLICIPQIWEVKKSCNLHSWVMLVDSPWIYWTQPGRYPEQASHGAPQGHHQSRRCDGTVWRSLCDGLFSGHMPA